MPLGMEVGLVPGHIVLHGDPASLPQKGQRPPIFFPCLLWPNGWMDQDVTWREGRPRPRPHCVTWGPSSPPKGDSPPIFGPCQLWTNGHPSQLLLNICLLFHKQPQANTTIRDLLIVPVMYSFVMLRNFGKQAFSLYHMNKTVLVTLRLT